jgi:hypothetical protein
MSDGPERPGPPTSASAVPRDLAAIVRQKLAAGELPKAEEVRLTLHLGLVSPCAACEAPITGMESVAELHDGRKLRFHVLCVEAWQRERGAGGDRARLVVPQPDWEGNNPEVLCAACGLRIQPFDGRYVLRTDSFHPECYERSLRTDAAAKREP